MKPVVLSLILTGFATHLTALSLRSDKTRPSSARALVPNLAVLEFDHARSVDAYLVDWLRQIDARVEYAPQGRIYHLARSFTLRVSSLPRHVRAEVVREIRRALVGERRVDGALVDGERVGMHVEPGED